MSLRANAFGYTGNALDNNDKPGGSDFTGKLAIGTGRDAAPGAIGAITADIFGSDLSSRLVAQALVANNLQAFNATGGYQTGTAADVNRNTSRFLGIVLGGDSSHFASGTYVGDGVSGLSITDPGWEPDIIIIKGEGTQTPVYRFRSMPDTNSSRWTAAAFVTDCILRELANGFQVGDHASVNTLGVTYYWIAIKIPAGQGGVGSYSGNSTDNTDITVSGMTQTPIIGWVKGDAAVDAVLRGTGPQAGDLSTPWRGTTRAEAAGWIQSFGVGTFNVGTDAMINASGTTYYYAMIADEVTAALAFTPKVMMF